MSYGTLISTVTVGAGGAASIDFTSIPGTYTDLMVVASVRSNFASDTQEGLFLKFNTSSTSFSARDLNGSGSAAASNSFTSNFAGYIGANAATANTFSNTSIYIPNYAGSTNKSFSSDSVPEHNGSRLYFDIVAGLWSNTAAITSISLYSQSASNWLQYSSATIYGITKGSSGGVTVS